MTNLVALGIHHKLHERLLLTTCQGVLHSTEACAIDVHLLVLLASRLLTKPHGAYGRIAEAMREVDTYAMSKVSLMHRERNFQITLVPKRFVSSGNKFPAQIGWKNESYLEIF
jgi:hypothetical protein